MDESELAQSPTSLNVPSEDRVLARKLAEAINKRTPGAKASRHSVLLAAVKRGLAEIKKELEA